MQKAKSKYNFEELKKLQLQFLKQQSNQTNQQPLKKERTLLNKKTTGKSMQQ